MSGDSDLEAFSNGNAITSRSDTGLPLSRRALAPVWVTQTGASALRLRLRLREIIAFPFLSQSRRGGKGWRRIGRNHCSIVCHLSSILTTGPRATLGQLPSTGAGWLGSSLRSPSTVRVISPCGVAQLDVSDRTPSWRDFTEWGYFLVVFSGWGCWGCGRLVRPALRGSGWFYRARWP